VQRFLVGVVALSMVFVAAACSDGGSDDPQKVMEAYFAAWSAEDVDQIMTYVAPDASLEIDAVGAFRNGPDEIRAAFETAFERWDFIFGVSDFEVDGDTVSYNVVASDPEGNEIFRGRSQATVVDGLVTAEEEIGPYQE
jgi:ketosteroid isomerase-like protein